MLAAILPACLLSLLCSQGPSTRMKAPGQTLSHHSLGSHHVLLFSIASGFPALEATSAKQLIANTGKQRLQSMHAAALGLRLQGQFCLQHHIP